MKNVALNPHTAGLGFDCKCRACGKEFESATRDRKCPACKVGRKHVLIDRRHTYRQVAFGLGAREYQITQMVAEGLGNKEIAAATGLTYGTIKEYMHHVFKKAGVHSRTMLALWLLAKEKEAQLIASTFGTLTTTEAARAQIQVQIYGKGIALPRAAFNPSGEAA